MSENNVDTYIPKRALVVVPHADDIEFGVAGTVAKWTDAGAVVTFVIVTDNSSGSNDPNVDLQNLIDTRKNEQIAAALILGVTDVRLLGYQDGVLEPNLELRRDLTRIIREVRPDVVVSLDPTVVISLGNSYINHPDHRAAAEATLYAVFPSAETRPIFPELLEEGLEPHKVKRLYLTLTDHITHRVDISETIERKQEALRCHKSQLGKDVIKWITEWNAEEGQKVGVAYAEFFRLIVRETEDDEESGG